MTVTSFLLVDDNVSFLELIGSVAESAFEGARVVKLCDARNLLALCAKEEFDCIVLDYQMPGMDGLVAAKALRAMHPYLPIVLVTGAGDEEVATSALRNGVTDYIPKSRLQPQSLQRALKNAMQTMSQSRIIDEQRQELETFAYALAHDFKQPLRQIITFAQLIDENASVAESTDLKRFSGFMLTAADRLGRLVDVMSEYTLIGRPVEMSDIEISPLISGLEQALSHFISERNAQVVLSNEGSCHGNEVLMTQVLQNLIVNGIKYNESPQPTVWIECEATDTASIITVRDNGIGIEEEYLEKVFQPLVRLHGESQYPGTGLGLTMSRKAVAAQSGSISCTSEVGLGSTFVIRAPLAKAAGWMAAA